MKKNVIIFSLFLCMAFLGSCNKDQDRTSNTETPANNDSPAEDPGAVPLNDSSGNGSQAPNNNTSSQANGTNSEQQPDTYTENQNTTSSRGGNTLNENSNRTSKENEDSLTGTGVAGEQGSGSGIGNGGSINAAKEKKK